MAASLPTAADVRKTRERAAKNAAGRAEPVRTPLFAVLGAGDLAVSTVAKAVAAARARAAERAEKAAELPGRFTADELRKAVGEIRAQAVQVYTGFAERGEKAWGRLREQPPLQQVVSTLGSYGGKLDARVDGVVDNAHDAAAKAMSTVSHQTRATGDKLARATERFTGKAAATVAEVAQDASETVAHAGAQAAEAIDEAGAEAARGTSSAARKTADHVAPKRPDGKSTVRRTAATDATPKD